MSLFRSRPSVFRTAGRTKLEFIVDAIDQVDEEPYKIAAGEYTEGGGEIEAGHEVTIWGWVSTYHQNEQKIEINRLRMALKVNSSPMRFRAESGIIGGGVFESDEYVEAEINVEPRCVKDVVEELRTDKNRGFRVDGYAVSQKVFRIPYFLLFAAKQQTTGNEC